MSEQPAGQPQPKDETEERVPLVVRDHTGQVVATAMVAATLTSEECAALAEQMFHQSQITSALHEYQQHKQLRTNARRALHDEIARSDLPVTQIAQVTGYSRERVRQIRKERHTEGGMP